MIRTAYSFIAEKMLISFNISWMYPFIYAKI
ncbi:hypothetical protein BSR82_03540 [Bacillus subtilis]|nr:hypothetical protein BSR82_03540 [Bacillus subtilis]